MMEVHKPDKVCYVPCFASDPNKEDISVEDISLFTHKDTSNGEETLIVFRDSALCEEYVNKLADEHKTDCIVICVYENIETVRSKVLEDFGRPVQLIVKERTDEI